ncbi:hypothetical protein A6B44_01430 [Pasteurella skyensis]|nr:hypothetical protein A6B44_01430 [Pasteurella skyensis]
MPYFIFHRIILTYKLSYSPLQLILILNIKAKNTEKTFNIDEFNKEIAKTVKNSTALHSEINKIIAKIAAEK